jgi:hypothetical protein
MGRWEFHFLKKINSVKCQTVRKIHFKKKGYPKLSWKNKYLVCFLLSYIYAILGLFGSLFEKLLFPKILVLKLDFLISLISSCLSLTFLIFIYCALMMNQVHKTSAMSSIKLVYLPGFWNSSGV